MAAQPYSPQGLGNYQQFADFSYNQAKSRLDPQFAQGRERLEQNLVNRGIMPGNVAYDRSIESFGRQEADAHGQARAESLAQALGIQNQQFNQDFSRERADFSDLSSLLGYGQGVTAQNNATLGADQQRLQGLLGFIPGLSPTPTDASGAIGNWYSQYNQNSQNDAAKRNAQWQAAAQLASAWLGS